MTQPTIALGLETVLDVATARRLYDYGNLDDAGVAAALEQTGRQGSLDGNRRDHLTRIQHVAAVIDSGDDITMAAFEAGSIEEEAAILPTLFALFPEEPGRAVAWRADAWKLLLRRAYLHELPAPQAVCSWARHPLHDLFDDQAGSGDYDVQADAVRLYGNHSAALDGVSPALRSAIHWHDMDLRRRCVFREIDADTRRERVARVIAQIQSGPAAANDGSSA